MEYHVFPRAGKVRVERPAKFGGDAEYSGYAELRDDYAEGKVHPADLKATAARYLNAIMEPARAKLNEVMN